MHENGKQLLNLMFRPGETVCVSHNKFGYHSVPLEKAIGDKVALLPTEDSLTARKLTLDQGIERVPTDQLLLVALNPIQGYRHDINCYKFRNFLIEMDTGPLAQQLDYIKRLGMPYSAIVFSGGKSLHFLVSLDKDLPNEKMYRLFSNWTLGIVSLSDQNCQNPSRSIRIPGAERTPGKFQKLVELVGPVKTKDFYAWLNRFPDSKPKPPAPKKARGDKFEFHRLSQWTIKQLNDGLDTDKGRNKIWFAIACDFVLAGYSEDDTLDILSGFFVPERDFKEREWKTSVKSAFKHMYENRK